MDNSKTISNSGYVNGVQNYLNSDCLKCGHSFSEEGSNNADMLRYRLHNWAIVEDNGVCEEFI